MSNPRQESLNEIMKARLDDLLNRINEQDIEIRDLKARLAIQEGHMEFVLTDPKGIYKE